MGKRRYVGTKARRHEGVRIGIKGESAKPGVRDSEGSSSDSKNLGSERTFTLDPRFFGVPQNDEVHGLSQPVLGVV